MTLRRILVAAAFVSVSLSASAWAGNVFNTDYCWKNSDGSGGCDGTFLGFRNDPTNGSVQAEFVSTNYGPYFVAFFSNLYLSCTPTDAAVIATFHDAMASHGYFYIAWDSSGHCNYLSVYNISSAN